MVRELIKWLNCPKINDEKDRIAHDFLRYHAKILKDRIDRDPRNAVFVRDSFLFSIKTSRMVPYDNFSHTRLRNTETALYEIEREFKAMTGRSSLSYTVKSFKDARGIKVIKHYN